MKLVAPDATKRRLIQTGALLLGAALSGCISATPRREERSLIPLFAIEGGNLVTSVDVGGNPQSGSVGPYTTFLNPVAVAAYFNDVYVADLGSLRLYRYDRSRYTVTVMPEQTINAGVRLQTGPDGSLYILDPHVSEIRRYTRAGRSLPTLKPRLATSRYVEFTIEPQTGRCFAFDAANRCIDRIEPLGQIAIEFLRITDSGPIATDGRSMFIAGGQCRCVTEWINGHLARDFGRHLFSLPTAMVQLERQLIVIDAYDNSLVVLHEDGGERIAPRTLGLLAPTALSVDQGILYVADATGHRITAFHLRRH